MLALSVGIGVGLRMRLGRTVSTPSTVAMNEKSVSTSSGSDALPSARSPIDIEKTTKLAPIRIDALVSAIPDSVMLVELASDEEVVDLLGKFIVGVAGLAASLPSITSSPLVSRAAMTAPLRCQTQAPPSLRPIRLLMAHAQD